MDGKLCAYRYDNGAGLVPARFAAGVFRFAIQSGRNSFHNYSRTVEIVAFCKVQTNIFQLNLQHIPLIFVLLHPGIDTHAFAMAHSGLLQRNIGSEYLR